MERNKSSPSITRVLLAGAALETTDEGTKASTHKVTIKQITRASTLLGIF